MWDARARMLFVGDTLYEWEHIVFPPQGSICAWLASVDGLVRLVRDSEGEGKGEGEVRINCGHRTAMRPALDVLLGAQRFMLAVLDGTERVRRRFEKRGLAHVGYVQAGGRFSLICPEGLVEDARGGVAAV